MDLTLSLGITNKVSAINSILSSIGMIGVDSDEDIEYNVDAGDADKLIDRISQIVQLHQGFGLWFNRESFHKFTPDETTGYVRVPNNVMVCKIKRGNGAVVPINLRGTLLFDSDNYGYDMREAVSSDGKVACVLVVNLPFDTLPTSAKHAIVDQARYWMVNDKEGDTIKLDALRQQASISMLTLTSEDNGQKRRNAFDNKYIQSTVMKVGGYNNN